MRNQRSGPSESTPPPCADAKREAARLAVRSWELFAISSRTRDIHHPPQPTVRIVDDHTPPTMAHLQGSGSPITQVSQTPVAPMHLQPQLLTRLQLDLRGKRFTVDRETIMNLPESILLCLFPNGLVLSRQSAMLSDSGDNDEFEELYGVDVRCPDISHPLCSPPPVSSTQIVSPSSSRSSNSPLTPFTAHPAPPDSTLPNNSSLTVDLLPRTSTPPLLRTPSYPNRRLLCCVKSWSTSLYQPRQINPLLG